MICLVTDRHRRDVVEQAAAAAAAGVDLVQVREPGMDGGALLRLVSAAVRAVAGSATRVVVNERFDVALAAGASGVHLRSNSVPAAAVRAAAPPGFLVGRSVHSRAEAERSAQGVDYLIAGTVFPTSSKPEGAPLLGIDGLRSICAGVRVPVLAIGGISTDRLDAVRAAGASGVAAIGWFDGRVAFAEIVAAVKSQFDTA